MVVLSMGRNRTLVEEVMQLLLTIEQVAERLNLSRSQLYIIMRRGELPSVRIGRSRRIAFCDLERYIEKLREAAGGDGAAA